MSDTDKQEENLVFTIKVNGIEIEVKRRELTAREILELAKQHGAMPGKPEEYILQGDKGKYGPDDRVDLAEENVFITIPNTPTQVA